MMISILPFPHPKLKGYKKVHRLVILPDYQGAGIGLTLLNEVGKIYKNEKFRYSIVTSAPSLINALKRSNLWVCKHFGRKQKQQAALNRGVGAMGSPERITASFELK